MPVELKKKFLDNIVNDSDRLAALITNILDLEKLSNGREVMDKKQHSLKDTLHKAVDGVYQLALKKQVKIDVNEIESINLYYDEDRILQVFTNLLSNSIKFVSSKDGVIKVKTQLTDTTVLMIFEDNGKGIPQEDMEFIFDKFYQSNNQNVKKPMGSGMGLAISRHIIESHHGSIRVDPDFIDGARFIVEFKN